MLAEIEIKNIEVSGKAMMAFTEGLPDYLSEFTKTILYHYKIDDPQAEAWYSLEDNIMALDDLQSKFGKSVLYEIGKSVVNVVKVDKIPKSLKEALQSLEDNINCIHKNGPVCEIEIVKLSLRRKKALLRIETPYPIELLRGVLAGIARKYTVDSSVLADVEVDEEKSLYPLAFYKITW